MTRARTKSGGFVAAAGVASAAAAALAFAACGPADFDPASKVAGAVRVLAARAEPPYARPGETVKLELLAVDTRPVKTRPMRTFWVPLVCMNPANDAYYGCFAQLAGGATLAGDAGAAVPPVVVVPDGGVPGGLRDALRPGVDLTPFLVEGTSFAFPMPADAVATHPATEGAPVPYGLAIAFNVTCAGHVEIVARDENPQAPPVGCFDEAGKPLPPEDYVIGFTRVYAYDVLRNANPVVDAVTFDGAAVQDGKVEVEHCSATPCPQHEVDVVVPEGSQEERPNEGQAAGKERLWATYYATDGKLEGEGRILYDSQAGRVDDRAMKWEAPDAPGEQHMWIVVRDNRGGAAWRELSIVVR